MNHISLVGFLRSLTRHRLYATLNIGGLAVGIAVFLVLGLYVQFQTSFERWLPHHDQVSLVETLLTDSSMSRPSQSTPMAFWDAVSRELPGTVGTRIYTPSATVLQSGVGVPENIGLVDPAFFDVFALPVVEGDAPSALRDPSNIIISQHTAAKYFPGADPIGKPLSVVYGGEQHAYRIAAVIKDLPKNTDLEFDLVARLVVPNVPGASTYEFFHKWNYLGPNTYMRFQTAEAAQRFQEQLSGLVKRNAIHDFQTNTSDPVHLSLQPITSVHFELPGSKLTVTTLGIVGVLTLLIAIVNYVNLATARAGLRAREVAMRKVLGADRATLIRHFIGEAVVTAAIAGFFGLVVAEAGLPLVNAASGLTLAIHYWGSNGVLLPLALLVAAVGAGAGIYPALILSRFPAAAVLASARSPGGGRAGARVREALVVFQFALAIAFIIGTGVLFAQTRHVRTADVGYDRSGLLVVPSLASASLDSGQRATLLQLLGRLPGVSKVTTANASPGGSTFRATTSVSIPGIPGDGPSIDYNTTTPGFFDVIGARLLAGRVFDLSHPGDATGDSDFTRAHSIVINRSAVTALHFASPQAAIGKTVGGKQPRTIIGVVDDLRFYSPRLQIEPTLYEFKERDPQSPIALLRFTGDPKALIDAARQTWRRAAPQVPFDAKTTDQRLDHYYEADDRAADLFSIGAGLAVAIGCVGLWGLASFNTARRVKEIGIRKTLGASSTDVVKLLVGQFLRPVLIANLFGWPMAWFAMRTWLAGFDDHITLSPLFFVGATVLALAIAILTVIAQSLRAARAAPAWALRHE